MFFFPCRVETYQISYLISYRSSIVLIQQFTFHYSPFLSQWEPSCFILVQVTKNTKEQVSFSWIRNKHQLSHFRLLCQLWTTSRFKSRFIAVTTPFPSRGSIPSCPSEIHTMQEGNLSLFFLILTLTCLGISQWVHYEFGVEPAVCSSVVYWVVSLTES